MLEFLNKFLEKMKKTDRVRREIQEDMRRTLHYSKQAIHFMHQERFNEAEESLKGADELFNKFRETAKNNPDLICMGLVNAAFQEYAEAQTFLGLLSKKQFIHPDEIGVPATSYILGLADVVGELRRRTLDSLRREDVETAENSLRIMEQIYIKLMSMDSLFLIIPELRRKCDIARRIIETTRGDVTIEIRRSSLERSIRSLERTLRETENA